MVRENRKNLKFGAEKSKVLYGENLKFGAEKSKVLKLCIFIILYINYLLFILCNSGNNKDVEALPSKIGHLKNCCTTTFHTVIFLIFAA